MGVSDVPGSPVETETPFLKTIAAISCPPSVGAVDDGVSWAFLQLLT